MQLQSLKVTVDESKLEYPSPDCAEDAPITTALGGKEGQCKCTDAAANNLSGEIVTTTKGEIAYSELPSTTHPREQGSSGGVKSETKTASTTSNLGSGYKGLVGEHGNPWVPQEALYDQPVSLSTWY